MEIQKEFQKLHKRFDKFEGKLDQMDAKFATKDDLKAFATKGDLKAFATKGDLRAFATKDDLKIALDEQSKDLKAFAEEQTEHLARIIATTVAEPLDQHLRDATLYEEVTMNVWKKLAKQKKF